MNARKWLGTIMVFVLVLMVACSKGNESGNGNVPEGTGTANNKKDARITVTYMASGTYDKAAEEVAEGLKAQGIQATVAAFPWATLREKNTTDLISKTGNYDVMSGGYYLADVYDHFASLDEFIGKDQYGKTLIDGLMDKSEHFQGKQIGIPYGADAYGIMYRTDLFEEAGLSLPQTWDQFQAAVQTLQEKYGQDGTSPYVFAAGATEQLANLFFTRYDSYFVNKDGKYALDAEKALHAINEGTRLLKAAPDNVMSLSIDEANALFIEGKAAIYEGWPSFVRVAADDPAKSKITGKWAVLPYPDQGLIPLSLWQMFMPKETKQPEAAWEWMKAFASEKNDKAFFEKYGISPIYTSTYEDQDIVSRYGHYFNGVKENLKRARTSPLIGEAEDFLAATLGDIFSGKLTPEKGIQTINDKWLTIAVPETLMESGKRSGLVQE